MEETLAYRLNEFFVPAVEVLEKIIFWDIAKAAGINLPYQVPFIVVWLIFGGVYFTVRLRFLNIRGFWHAIKITLGKFDTSADKGEVSHFKALATALSATVGLGNIAGVAVAIVLGGPGATFWIVMAGFFGMSLKFSECTLGLKYRKISADGTVSGGPMYYLEEGFKKKKLRYIGSFFAYSTMISWSYCGLKGFLFLSSKFWSNTRVPALVFQALFLFFVILGSATILTDVITFSDMMILGLAFPNLLGLLLLNKEIRHDMESYFRELKN